MSQNSFSFQEILEVPKVSLENPPSLTAGDGVALSFRTYIPDSPRAALLFYHGGGAYSGAGYQTLGIGLQKKFDTLVFMPDIRGHGASGGPRGDAPTSRQVWDDITTFINHIHAEYPNLPLFLGGHSSGAGLVLNYSSQAGHEKVAGYVFLSPEFGFRAQTAQPAQAHPFARVNVAPFILNAFSGGRLWGHNHAVFLNYPAKVLASDKNLITSYTVNMANAVTPSAPQKQFAALDRPFGLWIGAEDELINPDRLLAYAGLAQSFPSRSQAGSIPGEKHLSVLVKAHESIGPWIIQRIQEID